MKSLIKLVMILTITGCTYARDGLDPPVLPKAMNCSYNTEEDVFVLDKNCEQFIRDYADYVWELGGK